MGLKPHSLWVAFFFPSAFLTDKVMNITDKQLRSNILLTAIAFTIVYMKFQYTRVSSRDAYAAKVHNPPYPHLYS